ncbi:MAG: alpha/beta hydrolase [Chitinophagales bacterium]|nr:alpha/beta hydrolase [Chitinophagales bacterium]
MDKYLEYQDIRGYYSDEGNGNVLVFVHGFGEDSQVWESFVTAFSSYRIIRPDLPGMGRSSLTNTPLTMEWMAKYIKAILDKESIDKVTFIGHSMGGYIGLSFCDLYPTAVNGLVLFHSHAYADDAEKKQSRYKAAEHLLKAGSEVFIRELYQNLFGEKYKAEQASEYQMLMNQAKALDPKALAAASKAMAERKDSTATLQTIEVPVLFILGKEDKAIPFDKSMTQTSLPKYAIVHLLEQVGHMGMYEAKASTQQIISDFLKNDIN